VFGELKLKEGDVFLDLGCGPGDYAIYASRFVGESGTVYALDRLESNVSELMQTAMEEGLGNITAAASDITGPFPIDDACVDVSLLATVLHIPDVTRSAEGLCSEIRRVLKPDGRMVVIDCHKKDLRFGPPEHMRLSAEEATELMEKCGFKFLRQADLGYNYLIQFTK
jgi:ubiquinone/menaquinone biosynthesis C-methylase UbiE